MKPLKILLIGCLIIFGSHFLLFSQEILFSSNKDGTKDIWVMNSDRTAKENLSLISHDPDGQYQEEQAKWSPDGLRIAFRSDKTGVFNLWIMNADGSGDDILTDINRAELSPCWSPDGSRIYFARNTQYPSGAGCAPCQYWEIYYYDMQTNAEERLTYNNYRENVPIVSPDGAYIAYNKSENASDCCNPTDIWIMDNDGQNQMRLVGDGDWRYEWLGAWGAVNNLLFFAKHYSSSWEIAYIDISDPSNIFRVTTDSYYDLPAAFSPDGNRILFTSTRGGNYDVWTMDIDGQLPFQLTTGASDDRASDWKSGRQEYKIFFDDFNYSSYEHFSGMTDWVTEFTSETKVFENRNMYYLQEFHFPRGYIPISDGIENGILELNLYKGDKGYVNVKVDDEMHEFPTSPYFQTSKAFNKGIYAARIWLDDTPNPLYTEEEDGIVEAFWIQTTKKWESIDSYAECDFEYYPEKKLPLMQMVSYEMGKKKTDRFMDEIEGYLGVGWIGLVIKVESDQYVEYSIYDGNTNQLINNPKMPFLMPFPKFAPEHYSPLFMLFGISSDSRIIKNNYSIKIDWMMHIQDDVSLSWADIINEVSKLRNVHDRIDTTTCEFPHSIY